MSQELLDKIRYRKDHPGSIDWREAVGEEKALKWVLRLFKEHENSLKRKVLFEKIKIPQPRKKKVARVNELQHIALDAGHLMRLIDRPIGIGYWGSTL